MDKEKIIKLKKEIENISKINSLQELNELKVKYLGKKGSITEIFSMIKEVPASYKKEFGILVGEIKNIFNQKYERAKQILEQEELNKKLESETIDVTLPGFRFNSGSLHPLTKVCEELEDLFVSMGYDIVDGPEIDSDENCFEKLNLPKGHPARDMQDSFYITEDMLLRPHTSPVQIRTMLANKDKTPIRMICHGKVYRRDNDDATHSHQFMQLEGLVVDKDISLAHLKGTLEIVAKKMLGENTKVRFRPSYFPFTEPSYEVDISCFKCGGKGCAFCKQTGFIEILGSGMVHPNVLRACGYDPEIYSGFAFGLGIERMAIFKYNIPDIRSIYTNDIRFLKQFARKDEENEIKY